METGIAQLSVLQAERFMKGPRQVTLLIVEEGSDRAEQQIPRDGRDGVQIDHRVVVESVLLTNLNLAPQATNGAGDGRNGDEWPHGSNLLPREDQYRTCFVESRQPDRMHQSSSDQA